MRTTAFQFARYVIVGVMNTALGFALLNAASAIAGVYAGLPIAFANASIGLLIIGHSYLWNKRWTFRSAAPRSYGEAGKFLAVNLGALALDTAIVYTMTTHAAPPGVSPLLWLNVAKAVSLAVVIMWNCSGFKWFVFWGAGRGGYVSMGRFQHLAIVGAASLTVGLLYLAPLLAIQEHLRRSGQPFAFGFESYRNDLIYLAWAREVYDGHFPPRDPFSDAERPIFQHPLPSLIMAGFLAAAGGAVVPAYFAAVFVFSQLSFLLWYALGWRLFRSIPWALALAVIAVITPMALRIMNFDGTA